MKRKRKHPLDFPGSQAALWRGRLAEVLELDSHAAWPPVAFRFIEGKSQARWWGHPESMTPIGPVARALLKVRK
jgi:hypothetical protein